MDISKSIRQLDGIACKRLLMGSVLIAALGLGTACNQTIQCIGIPENVTWNEFLTGFLSPYDDLSVTTVGDHIDADLEFIGIWGLCQDASSDAQYLVPIDTIIGGDYCTEDDPLLRILYWYALGVLLDRPSFQAGGVQLVSAAAGTVQAISVAINGNTSQMELNAGISEGTIPFGLEANETAYVLDNAGYIEFGPPDPGFGPGGVADVFECGEGEFGGDAIAFFTNAPAGSYTATCGSISLTYTLQPPYNTIGECIIDRMQCACSHHGFTGRDLAACQMVQISNCQAIFHVSGHP